MGGLLERASSSLGRLDGLSRSLDVRVYEEVQRRAIVSIRRVSGTLGISIPTVTSSLRRLEDLGIVRETTGRRYSRMFAYHRQLEILNETKDIVSRALEHQLVLVGLTKGLTNRLGKFDRCEES